MYALFLRRGCGKSPLLPHCREPWIGNTSTQESRGEDAHPPPLSFELAMAPLASPPEGCAISATSAARRVGFRFLLPAKPLSAIREIARNSVESDSCFRVGQLESEKPE